MKFYSNTSLAACLNRLSIFSKYSRFVASSKRSEALGSAHVATLSRHELRMRSPYWSRSSSGVGIVYFGIVSPPNSPCRLKSPTTQYITRIHTCNAHYALNESPFRINYFIRLRELVLIERMNDVKKLYAPMRIAFLSESNKIFPHACARSKLHLTQAALLAMGAKIWVTIHVGHILNRCADRRCCFFIMEIGGVATLVKNQHKKKETAENGSFRP